MRELEQVCVGKSPWKSLRKAIFAKIYHKNGFCLNKHQMRNNFFLPRQWNAWVMEGKKAANGERRDKCRTMNNIESHFMRCDEDYKREGSKIYETIYENRSLIKADVWSGRVIPEIVDSVTLKNYIYLVIYTPHIVSMHIFVAITLSTICHADYYLNCCISHSIHASPLFLHNEVLALPYEKKVI